MGAVWLLKPGALFRDGRLREPKPQQMGVQISRGLHSQVSQEDAVRGVEAASLEVSRRLAMQGCKVEEGHLMPDHVYMLISISPKYAVSQVIGYIKGKNAIHTARICGERKRNFKGQHFWAGDASSRPLVETKR